MIIFLIGFAVLIILVSHHFLIPALLASRDATPAEKRHIQAMATLLLTVVLFILGVGLVLVLRVKRFFVSSTQPQRQKTEYIDAWAEAGKRARANPDEQE
jgi:hypothetical protein